jgi:hypothetical protein
MLQPKNKGLFLDISDFSVLVARTSGYRRPFTVEEMSEQAISGVDDPEDVRSFLEGVVDFHGSSYFVSRCGVYPEGRFVHFHEVETVNKAKDLNYLTKVLDKEFKVKAAENHVAILDARDGADLDPKTSLTKQVIFCGGPTEAFRQEQERLLQFGIYPERMELSTCGTLGGLCDYTEYNGIASPVLFLELTLKSAHVFIVNRGRVEVSHLAEMGLDSIYPLLQRELGLKDERSARKLFLSNTFDFAEIGPKLLRRLTKDLQATTGFYEVQTGQTIEHLFLSVLPGNLSWVEKTIADALALDVLKPNYEAWLKSQQITVGDGVEVSNMSGRWIGLFSLMADFQSREEGRDEA